MTKYQRLFVQNGMITVRLVPELATEIGLHESLLLLQVDYLLSSRGLSHVDPKNPDMVWIKDSIRELQDKFFPFWSVSTIAQTIQGMLVNGFLMAWVSEDPKDQTRWLTLGPECSILKSVVLVDASAAKIKPAPVEKKPAAAPDQPNIFELAKALAEVTKTDFEMNKGRMLKEAKSFKDHTPVEIKAFFGPGSAWYVMDWRGKQGQAPTIAQVKSEWLKMSGSTVLLPKTVKTADGGLNI
jgi:hypothetical protein